jgi:hypothetical protein
MRETSHLAFQTETLKEVHGNAGLVRDSYDTVCSTGIGAVSKRAEPFWGRNSP